MAIGAVLTGSLDPTDKGAVITLVTPAADGCGMACPYCFIDRRGEGTATGLAPEHYAAFVHAVAAKRKVSAVTIQGREPLADSALAWTNAIFIAGKAIGAEIGLVTNGLSLEATLPLLAAHRCDGITVSLDSADCAEHDRLRRRVGSWEIAMAGLAAATRALPDARIVVNTVILPKRSQNLRDMPARLAEVGVKAWSLSPLIVFDRDGRAGANMTASAWREAVNELSQIAADHGVQIIADDEFGIVAEGELPLAIVRILSRPTGIMRMTPNGVCSFGVEILNTPSADAPRWTPNADVSPILQYMTH